MTRRESPLARAFALQRPAARWWLAATRMVAVPSPGRRRQEASAISTLAGSHFDRARRDNAERRLLDGSPLYPRAAGCAKTRGWQNPPVAELVCVECGASSEDGLGWRADVVTDDEGPDEPEVAVYCPLCWQERFGDGS